MADIDIVDSPKVDTLDFVNQELDKEQEAPAKEEALAEIGDADGAKDDEIIDDLAELPEIKDDEISFGEPFKRSEVIKAYPDIFKKFPDLEKKIYRGEKYEEIFPTLKDANDAKERAETLSGAEQLLFAGDVTDILKSVRNEDEEAFKRIVENFLPTIERLDKSVYLHVMGNVGRFFIKNMLAEAQRFGKDTEQYKALVGSATIQNQFLFGNSQFQELVPLAKPVSEGDKRVSEREQQLINQRFVEVRDDLIERADNAITATINKYIDPRESMSSYVRAKAVDDVKRLLDNAIGNDTRFKGNLDHLWQNLIAQDFNKSAQEAIKNAYFNKAKTLLFDIIKKVRSEALSGKATTTARSKDNDNEPERERKDRAQSAAPKRGQEERRKGESTIDYLNRVAG